MLTKVRSQPLGLDQSLDLSLVLSLVHTLQKLAPETGAINSTPDSGASFSCRLHLARKKLAPIYGVEIDNGRRLRRSFCHPTVIITQFNTEQKIFCEEKIISNPIFSSHHFILQFQDRNLQIRRKSKPKRM